MQHGPHPFLNSISASDSTIKTTTACTFTWYMKSKRQLTT